MWSSWAHGWGAGHSQGVPVVPLGPCHFASFLRFMAGQVEHHQSHEKLRWGTGDIKFPPPTPTVTPVTCEILSCSQLEDQG